MSNASLQAQRAGIRESSGFSNNAPTRPGGTIPQLRPNDDAIRKLLEGKKIAQLDEKYKAVQAIFNQRPALALALNASRKDLHHLLTRLNGGVLGDSLQSPNSMPNPLQICFAMFRTHWQQSSLQAFITVDSRMCSELR